MRVFLRCEFERRRRGWTQADLAARAGVPQQKISEGERGLRHAPTLRALARVFSISEQYAHTLLDPIDDPMLNPFARAEKLEREFAEKTRSTDAFDMDSLPGGRR
jgi:transcriptional regulator with XRE-family HTH domain